MTESRPPLPPFTLETKNPMSPIIEGHLEQSTREG
jgi:hypothetical protein